MPKPRNTAPPPVTIERVRDALSYIPPSIDRETWVRIAMAIKAEFGAEGFEAWEQWSQGADDFNAAEARDTWRSIKAGGAVKVATLFGIAKDHGYKPARASADARTKADPAELQRQAAEREQRRQAEEAELQRMHEEAAGRSLRLWNNAAEALPLHGCPYLQRKGVGSHGLRFLPGHVAVVPMRDAAGRLWSIQRLLPKKLRDPATGKETTDKLYGPGKTEAGQRVASRKTGLFHLIGQAEGDTVLLLAEGYATAATLHEATGRPVAVCFDAGNLLHVAAALRDRWPLLPLLICADDDRRAEAQGKKNAGREKASAAAELAGAAQGLAAVVLPAGLPDDGSDFNDLAQAQGLDAVAGLVEAAAAELVSKAHAVRIAREARPGSAPDAPAAEQTTPPAPPAPALRLVKASSATSAPASKGRPRARPGADDAPEGEAEPGTADDADTAPGPARGRGSRRGRGGSAGGPPGGAGGGSGGDGEDQAPPEWDAFTVNDAGVWHTARDAEGNPKKPQWVCSRLDVTARTRADDANGWGYLLEFTDPDGNAKSWAMPAAMLSGEGSEWAGRLRDMGLTVAPGTQARNLVAKYIDTRKTAERVTCTDRVGWHGPVYVLPSGSIASAAVAAEGRRYVFQSDSCMEDAFRRHGTLQQWQAEVAALCVGNSRLAFAVCCAFAGPMLRLAEVESGGVHFRGNSSQGKTTALRVATSVWGRPSYMQRWRTTDNALEATAVQHCDALLVLDEFGQLDPKVAGDVAYMLANDSEKSRGTRTGLLRKRRTWRLLFLSSGEVSLAQHMEAGGKTARAGQEVRMLDIPLDAGTGMGGLEALHGHDRPAALADAVVSASAHYYGTPGRAWLEWACEHFAELPGRLASLLQRFRDAMVPDAAAEQVRRAGTRFALIAAAGELATEAGVTGWPAGQAEWAARQCFNAWLGARGHMDNGEEAAMLRQVRRFLELHGEGRFTFWHRAMDDHAPKTLNRAGFRRLLGDDGKPVRSDSDHQREYGERISPLDGERAQVEYMILPEVFAREVCQGFDCRAVAEQLRRRGHLDHEAGRLTYRHRLPGMGKAPVYHIKPSIFDDVL